MTARVPHQFHIPPPLRREKPGGWRKAALAAERDLILARGDIETLRGVVRELRSTLAAMGVVR